MIVRSREDLLDELDVLSSKISGMSSKNAGLRKVSAEYESLLKERWGKVSDLINVLDGLLIEFQEEATTKWSSKEEKRLARIHYELVERIINDLGLREMIEKEK